jgi:phosphoserine phosphatase
MSNEKIKTKLFLFDMDGVIFEGSNFWLELHRYFGTEKEGLELANEFLNYDYAQLVKQVAGNLWKGKPASIITEMVSQRRYQPGIQQAVEFLHSQHIRTAIISSGPYELALRARRDLGIPTIRANRLIVQNGVIQGDMEVMVPDGEKARIGQEVISEMDSDLSHTAFIGDSDSDVELARLVGLSIAYNSRSQKMVDSCTYRLGYGELFRLPEIVQNF